jgi:GrpB-like predicted nucleotidyltransferase (UPF0157 family)
MRSAAEHDLIRRTMGGVAVAVHHVGSTAVPGLVAKPVIGILIEVTSLASLDALNDELGAIGCKPMGEFGIPGRR